MFENYRKFETTYAGRPLVVETGKTCGLSNGSCWVRYGETVVMANVTASAKPRPELFATLLPRYKSCLKILTFLHR